MEIIAKGNVQKYQIREECLEEDVIIYVETTSEFTFLKMCYKGRVKCVEIGSIFTEYLSSLDEYSFYKKVEDATTEDTLFTVGSNPVKVSESVVLLGVLKQFLVSGEV